MFPGATIPAAAALDPAREIRVAAAHGLGTVGDPRAVTALHRLTGDVLVRAAALAGAAGIGCPPPLAPVAVSLLAHPAWQVREGAARALGAADPDIAVPALLAAAGDGNLDVRKAAVRSLSAWADRPEVADALHAAAADPDADVRAWARRAQHDVTGGRRSPTTST